MPLLLIDLETEEGVTGRAWLFCYLRAAAPAIVAILGEAETATKGEPVAPEALWAMLTRRFALIGVQGIVRMALAGFDVAAWDALAIAAGQAARSISRRRTPAGFRLQQLRPRPEGRPRRARRRSRGVDGPWLHRREAAGSAIQRTADDIAAVRAVRRRIGDEPLLMVDYNQALTLAEALERGRALDAENIYWLEEPIRHDDYVGTARLVRELKTPIQIGENFSLPEGMQAALDQSKPQLCDARSGTHRRRQRLAARRRNSPPLTVCRCPRICSPK